MSRDTQSACLAPVQSPTRQPSDPRGPIGALLRPHWRSRETGPMGQQVIDRHVVLAVRGKLRHDLSHSGRVRKHPVTDQQPCNRCCEGLRHAERHVPRMDRSAEGLRNDQLAIPRERELAGRQRAVLDIATSAGNEGVKAPGSSGMVDVSSTHHVGKSLEVIRVAHAADQHRRHRGRRATAQAAP